MKGYDKKYQAAVSEPEPAKAALGLDPLVFLAGATAHAMLINKQATSSVARQSVEMARTILAEIERFYRAADPAGE